MEKGLNKEIKRFRELYNAALQMIVCKQKGIIIGEYLKMIGYHTVAIYGMNDLGNRLYYELLTENKITILYVIDQGFPKLYFDVPCYKLTDVQHVQHPDLVIVALPDIFLDVKKDIERYIDVDVLSITRVLYDAEIAMEG